MSLDERDKIIITIICAIVSFIFIVIIICFILWLIIRHCRSKAEDTSSNEENNSVSTSPYHRQQYQRSKKTSSTKITINNKRKKRKRRSNTNDSAITLSFDPPHLINQNVKNLEKLLSNESTLTASSWHYEETLPTKNRYYTNSSNEPVYASSSTVLTSISNLAVNPQQINNTNIHFLSELDHVLRLKQEEHTKHPLRYSQSCRQTTDLLPFDYYRSISPPSTITGTNSSNDNSLEPIYTCTNKYSNTTLARKARLAQLRDDTAILY